MGGGGVVYSGNNISLPGAPPMSVPAEALAVGVSQ